MRLAGAHFMDIRGCPRLQSHGHGIWHCRPYGGAHAISLCIRISIRMSIAITTTISVDYRANSDGDCVLMLMLLFML